MLSAYKNTAYVLLGGALCKAWQLIFSCFSLCALVKRCFLLAMYEKHGQPLETLIKNIIQTKFIRPKERPYQTENFYAVLERQRQLEKEVSAIVNSKRKTRRKQA